jgi:tRNA A37 threonylcarbamoyladenosine modification protein TsaB
MTALLLDASSRPVSWAVGERTGVSSENNWTAGLSKLIEASQISSIYLAAGPGSLVGLRSAYAFAQGVAMGCGGIISTVPTLVARVVAALDLELNTLAETEVLSFSRGRQREIVVQRCQVKAGGSVVTIGETSVVSFDATKELFSKYTHIVSDAVGWVPPQHTAPEQLAPWLADPRIPVIQRASTAQELAALQPIYSFPPRVQTLAERGKIVPGI